MRSYETVSGETWDMIAYKLWSDLGGEKLTSALIDANSEYSDVVIFSAGVKLVVPEVYIPASTSLPAWMS